MRILALLALVAGAGPAAAEPALGPLPWRVGGRVGFTLDAAAFPDSAGHQVELYVRVPPGTLLGLASDTLEVRRLRVSARLRAPGLRPVEALEEFALSPGDTVGGFGRVLMLRLPTRPGVQKLQVRLEDVHSRKRGIAYMGRNVAESAEISGEFVVSGPQSGGRMISDLEFVWAERPGAAPSAFRRGGTTLLPNPERLYGLFANQVRAAFTARGPEGDARPWRWIARMLDASGQVVAERESTAAAGPRLEAVAAFDLATQPSGGYDLEVKAWQEGDAGALLRRSRFSVAWQRDTWLRNPRDIGDDVHFLLQNQAEEAFALMHPGEQERFLEEFWRERDPSPDTAENEARETYYRRIDHANRTFGRAGIDRGMFSDMGRTWIRYGEPTEVLHQVIPAGEETLQKMLVELSLSEDRPLGDVQMKGLGGDQRPFEVWIYEGDIALPPDADPKLGALTRRKRLLFLFVDEHGLGDYRLRYSSE